MAVVFHLTPLDRFGIETNVNIVNVEREVPRRIALDRTDTKTTLLAKLVRAGRFKRVAAVLDLIVQRDTDIIHIYDAGRNRRESILLAELIRDGVVPPLAIRRTPDRDGDDGNVFDDLGDRVRP